MTFALLASASPHAAIGQGGGENAEDVAGEGEAISIVRAAPAFTPSRGETAEIAVALARPARLTLELLEPDGNVVRTLGDADAPLEPGTHVFAWDGADAEGRPVPDEAYVPRASARDASGTLLGVADPTAGSGGEALEGIALAIDARGIGFELPEPARVQVRLGIAGGPLLRNLANWAPRPAGRNRLAWDGHDASGALDLRDRDDGVGVVLAHALPDHAILVQGGGDDGYRRWFAERGFQRRDVAPEARAPSRDGVRIAPESYRSRLDDAPATLALALLDGDAPIERPHLLAEPAILRVDVDERGRRALTESLFEVGFFVNGEFVSEEEQGYLPISWRLDPARYGPGEHVLTVNVTAFDGRVATASTRFRVAETERQDDE